ncbi:MAG: hypothetical protein IJQ21_10590 [Lachnospiraceae bacterium]|nr:hypothetical protein [Lachnospiraceae bacterium]
MKQRLVLLFIALILGGTFHADADLSVRQAQLRTQLPGEATDTLPSREADYTKQTATAPVTVEEAKGLRTPKLKDGRMYKKQQTDKRKLLSACAIPGHLTVRRGLYSLTTVLLRSHALCAEQVVISYMHDQDGLK